MPTAIQILLVDDHALFRAGLRMLCATLQRDVQVLEAATIAEALRLTEAHPQLKLCLLDLALRNEDGIDALSRLKEAAPGVAVVIVSATEESAVIRRCLDAGAMSFIPKSAGPEMLTEALRQVLAGHVYLPQGVTESAGEAVPRAGMPALTPRQLDVLRALCRGLPTKLIARELDLSEYTVKDHITAIFQSLGVRNRTEAVIRAVRLGLPAGIDPAAD
ncbi:MAG: response regulator [Burkholderiaceae bacterium]